jgi:hypothetical protein
MPVTRHAQYGFDVALLNASGKTTGELGISHALA